MDETKSDKIRTFYYSEDLQNRKFGISYIGPWSPGILKKMMNRAVKELRVYKRDLVRRDKDDKTRKAGESGSEESGSGSGSGTSGIGPENVSSPSRASRRSGGASKGKGK